MGAAAGKRQSTERRRRARGGCGKHTTINRQDAEGTNWARPRLPTFPFHAGHGLGTVCISNPQTWVNPATVGCPPVCAPCKHPVHRLRYTPLWQALPLENGLVLHQQSETYATMGGRPYLSKMGLSCISRDSTPPTAPRAKKTSMPPASWVDDGRCNGRQEAWFLTQGQQLSVSGIQADVMQHCCLDCTKRLRLHHPPSGAYPVPQPGHPGAA